MEVKKLKIPDYQEVLKGKNAILLEENWDRFKIERSTGKFIKALDRHFLQNLQLLPTIVTFADTNTFPFKFYRVRKWTPNFNTSLISGYSYPPAEHVKYTQRANLPGSPVFYCSDNPATAIAETVKFLDKVNPKDVYYLSEWKFKPNLRIRLSPYIFENINKESFYHVWAEANKTKLRRTLKEANMEDGYEAFLKIMNFLSNLFIYENSYVVSSYIAHSHLYANHSLRADVFVYPSVQSKLNSVNYAIHPNAVAEKMELVKIFRISFDSIDKIGEIKYQISAVGRNQDSIIVWNNNLDQEVETLKEVFPEFKL